MTHRRNNKNNAEKIIVTDQPYWHNVQYPVYCLLFLLPFIVLYEVGIVVIDWGAFEIRNLAESWVLKLLRSFGFTGEFLSGIFLILFLLLWQYASKVSWKVKGHYLGLMLLESLAYALLMVLFSRLFFQNMPSVMSIGFVQNKVFANIVQFVGAGVYEEFLFRLIIVGGIVFLLEKLFKLKEEFCWIVAILLGAVLFSLFHYIGPFAHPFTMETFIYRFIAGILLSIFFYLRGFGIAAATHAFYNIIIYFYSIS